MKRCLAIVAVLAVALMAGVAAAQETGLVGKGLKLGLSMYTFGGSDNEMEGVSPDSRMGLGAGGFLTFALGPNLALQPELLYVQKGAKYEEGGVTATLKFDYLDIPVLLKYRFPTEGSIRPNLFAGPVGSIKMSADLKVEAGGEDASTDVSDEVKGFDFGVAFGGGLDFALSSSTLTFDVRYTLAMTDWPDTDVSASAKNNGWLVTVGVGF